ncbi:MAG TPA: D-sedoheptulose 7-phosphate isomerase [Pyrinomonadaceae bacterium]|nr:D-sedoheptulose 7-phosphate isomerase [Pyrinomonadaceae bacterium]
MPLESKKPPKQAEAWRLLVHEHILQSAELAQRTAEMSLDSILGAARLITKCFQQSNKVLICGNGGSAADAQHMAAEFVNRLSGDFERPGLPAIALTTDTSFLTAYANDFGYEGVFERQVATLGNRGDVLLAISTSGNSRNVIKAVAAARKTRLTTIGLLGEGGPLTDLVDHAVVVQSRDTQHVQECLLTIEHSICRVVERALFGAK